MTNLNIQTVNDSLVVDSRLVAAELGIQHKNLKELVKTYQADFEGFGRVAFETLSVVSLSNAVNNTTFCYLNEDQAYLLLTFVKNTPEARQAKVNLVKAFKLAREKAVQPQLPSDYLSALKALVAVEEEKSQLLLKAAAAESKIVEMTPKVETYNIICEKGKNLRVGEVAKILGVLNMGPNRLFDFLREQEVLMKSNQPYAKFEFEANYFTCIRGIKNGFSYVTPLVTPKGVDFIIRLLERNGYVVPSKAA
jgi:phage regulator Rha-like protein